jgi:hypothetical protein
MKSMSAWLHGCNQTALTNNLPLSQNNLPLSRNNGRLSYNLCFTIESTYLSSQCVEIVEATVVTVRWYIADIAHRIEIP